MGVADIFHLLQQETAGGRPQVVCQGLVQPAVDQMAGKFQPGV